jgi:YD repeat-containing protein
LRRSGSTRGRAKSKWRYVPGSGNKSSLTDRKNQTIQYVYDALNRLSSKTYPDSTRANYVYDLVGKIKQVTDPTGSHGPSFLAYWAHREPCGTNDFVLLRYKLQSDGVTMHYDVIVFDSANIEFVLAWIRNVIKPRQVYSEGN